MHAQVVRQLGVERREQQAAVAHEHGLAVELAEHLDLRAEVADAWRADEDAAQRDLVAGEVDVGLEALHLPAERVAIDLEVGEVEVLAIEDDHPRARAEDRARGTRESPRRARRARRAA